MSSPIMHWQAFSFSLVDNQMVFHVHIVRTVVPRSLVDVPILLEDDSMKGRTMSCLGQFGNKHTLQLLESEA